MLRPLTEFGVIDGCMCYMCYAVLGSIHYLFDYDLQLTPETRIINMRNVCMILITFVVIRETKLHGVASYSLENSHPHTLSNQFY